MIKLGIDFDSSTLTFDRLAPIVSDEVYTDISIIQNSSIEKPWMVDILMYSLSDLNPGLSMNSAETIESVAKLLVDYYNSSWSAFFDISSGDVIIETLIEHTQQDRFIIDAANGTRVATVNEVNEAIFKKVGDQIIELVNDPVLKLSDSEYKFINLFAWTVTGKWRYYKRAGYTYEFVNNKLKEPEVRYITRISNVLFRMCELLREDNYYSGIIDKLKNIKKAGNYKYPAYAQDEVTSDEKIIFVIDQLTKMMPRRKNKLLYECNRILYDNKSKPATSYKIQDKITLRKGYYSLKNPDDETFSFKADNDKIVAETKELCDTIRSGIADGLFGQNEFAVRIVGTLGKNDYRYCSEKQRRILVEAVNKINLAKHTRKQTSILEDAASEGKQGENAGNNFSIASMSDLLGRGMI